MECVSASGVTLPPCLIFKGENLNSGWIPSETPAGWKFVTSKKGWTSDLIGFECLKSHFQPFIIYKILVLLYYSIYRTSSYLYMLVESKSHRHKTSLFPLCLVGTKSTFCVYWTVGHREDLYSSFLSPDLQTPPSFPSLSSSSLASENWSKTDSWIIHFVAALRPLLVCVIVFQSDPTA